jgi:nucleoside-diphosphate-sugar epimerase
MNFPRDIVIAGCGYTGEAIGRAALVRGISVLASTRSPARAAQLQGAGMQPLLVEHSPQGSLPALQRLTDSWGVISFPPGPDADLPAWLGWMAKAGVRRVVYLSATSVYGSCHGEWVDEHTLPRPDSARGIERLKAEVEFQSQCQSLGREACIVRLPGIHGPGRTLRDRLELAQYRLVDDGVMFTNRVHVDDIASATLFLLAHPHGAGTWIVSDDEPFRVRELADWMCRVLDRPSPPSITLDEVHPSVRDFWQGDRRCSNQAIRSLGWTPTYPNFRAALLAAWAVEGRPVLNS